MPDSRNKRPSQGNRQRDNSVSSVHSVVRNVKLEIEHILRHARGLECFMRFAQREANDEGIRFWAAAHQFRMRFPEEDSLAQLSPQNRAETMDPITSQAQYIWNTYLKPGAQDEISCSDGVNREGIKQAIDQGRITCDLFSEMQLLALQDIKHNSLSKFRQSQEYTRFLDFLLGELQEPMNRMPSLVVNQAHFDLVLSNPLSRQLFFDYLNGKNASVYLRFVSDVLIYREPATSVERKKEAVRIFDMYLKPDAANSIRAGISEEKVISEVEGALPTGARAVFDPAYNAARSFVEKSHFQDFCQTPEFLQLRALLEEYKKLKIETGRKDGTRQDVSDESPRGPPSVSRSASADPFPRSQNARPQMSRVQHNTGGASRLGFASQDENSGFGYGPRFRDRYAKPERMEHSESSRSRSESSGKRERKEASRSRSGKDAAKLAAASSIKSTHDLLREIKERALRIQVRDLMELLSDQQLVNAYRDFCISEKSEENIMFWIDCEKFRTSFPRMKLTAMAVYRKYLDPDGQYALALSSEWSARVLAKLDACPDEDEPDEDLFVDALQAVAGIMLSDSFPRFMKSRQLERILASGGGIKDKEVPAAAPPPPGGSCCVVQ